jgi:hypothetical protein
MKEEVKITVIATGFKNDHPQRKDRGVPTAQMAISTARTAAVRQPPQAGAAAQINGLNGGGVRQVPVVRPAPARENPTLAAVTEAIKNDVEADDLLVVKAANPFPNCAV